MVRGDVDRVVGPVLHRDDGELRAVADDELDVLGVRSAAPLVEDHGRLGERLEADLQVAVGDLALARVRSP